MLKRFIAYLVLASMLFTSTASMADSMVENIFSSLGGTATIDKGGAIQSQTRSIYSLGGGMVSFQGKKLTLIAADPPSFSAGCSGISWHFGGFSFISMDQIRQLIESIAQASLGVAVDLAMQTLCPQCYAVMSKLRDIANMMRNASADACRIAHYLGDQLKQTGIYSQLKQQTDCNNKQTSDGTAGDNIQAQVSFCSVMGDITNSLDTAGKSLNNWLNGGGSSGTNTPTAEQVNSSGNKTYDALSALGYTDGVVKDLLLSTLGMAINYSTSQKDCRTTFQNLYASGGMSSDSIAALLGQASNDAATVSGDSSSAGTATVADAKTNDNNPTATGTKTGYMTCFAPPTLRGFQDITTYMLCGPTPEADMQYIANAYQIPVATLQASSVATMCLTTKATGPHTSTAYYVYHCDSESTRCMDPKMQTLEDELTTTQTSSVRGLAWMIMDGLFAGVQAISKNQALPPKTIQVLNGVDYPMYRLINLAAVYPGYSADLVSAYSAQIAIHKVLDTVTKLTAPGGISGIDTKAAKAGLQWQDVGNLRTQIMAMPHDVSSLKDGPLRSISEKRMLVDRIIEMNRALQSEVISQGMMGNQSLAVTLKNQTSAK